MHEHRYYSGDYILIIYYLGNSYRLRAKQIHYDRKQEIWQVYSKTRVFEFTWHREQKKLTENLLHGQPPVPSEFLQSLQEEFVEMHKPK